MYKHNHTTTVYVCVRPCFSQHCFHPSLKQFLSDMFVQLGAVPVLRHDISYRRNWLLSACAYNNRRQETMHLIRSIRLTASVRLIERAYASKAGPLTSCVSRCWTIVTVRAACESPCKHLPFSTRTC